MSAHAGSPLSEARPSEVAVLLAAVREDIRTVERGVATLPHAVDLHWTALRERGFTEQDRVCLAETLAAYDRAAPVDTLSAAFAWLAFGEPEAGHES